MNNFTITLHQIRFFIPINNHDVEKITIQAVGAKNFNDEAPLLKLEMSINTYRKLIKKGFLKY